MSSAVSKTPAEGADSVPVLVVDDDATKRLALRAVLAPLGYSIVDADSGEAALRRVTAQDFAVILLDVKMPLMDGFETAAFIRRRLQCELTPIIFITEFSSDDLLPAARYVEGAVDFMFAPVQPDELRAKVSVFASLFVRAQELAAQAREVQASADQLRLLTDAAPIGIFQTDHQNRYLYTNPRWTELMGISAGEAAGRTWEAIVGSEPRLGLISELADRAVDTTGRSRRFEIQASGTASRVVLATSESIPDSNGGVAGWVGTLSDDTAASRERASDLARRAAEEQYRRIVETTMEGIWLIDAKDQTTFVNEALARMLGTTAAAMQGRPISEFHEGDELSKAEQSIARRRAGVSEQLEIKLRRSDGTEIDALLNANPMFDEHGAYTGALAMVRDVTESLEQEKHRQRLEEKLRQSQGLQSIGQLAGGIAHDFNNLLMGIRGYGELALGRLERGEDSAADDIRDMLEASERATQLTRQLLAFGRRQVLQPEVVNLNDVVTGMQKLLRQLIGDQIELVTILSETPALVDVDRTQLEQVIVNLAVNARDAMLDGGRLAIEISLPGAASEEALLAVSDNGCGMDAETAAHVFEPFFSTKGAAGSGFGLATVHGIVSQSGGHMSLDSRPGQGTTFSIFLPLSKEADSAPPNALAEAEGGAETILVVDDDPTVRTIVGIMLDDLGYHVLAADGGEKALELATASDSEVDLILTDLVMPGPSGRETARHVRGLFPAAKVLYMSGYTDDVDIRSGALEPGTAFIQKPFGAEQLGASLRNLFTKEPA